MEKMTRRMKMKSVESLVCLVKSVENQFTTIDLQNETSLYGLIKEVDWYGFFTLEFFLWKCLISYFNYSDMNVTLSDVTLTDPNGNRYYCDNFFLKSRLIRYVHISRSVS